MSSNEDKIRDYWRKTSLRAQPAAYAKMAFIRIDSTQPVILLASSRPTGNTFSLARMVLPESAAPLVDLASLNIGYYSYSNANADDDFLPMIAQLVASPVWVIATPLYWYTMSAQAKTFLDRLSDLLSFRKSLGQQLRGKGLAVVCSGSDPAPPTPFNQPFELTCDYLGMRFLGCHYAKFDGDLPADPDADLLAEKFGSTLKP